MEQQAGGQTCSEEHVRCTTVGLKMLACSFHRCWSFVGIDGDIIVTISALTNQRQSITSHPPGLVGSSVRDINNHFYVVLRNSRLLVGDEKELKEEKRSTADSMLSLIARLYSRAQREAAHDL